MKVYKLPPDVNLEAVRGLRGSEGSRLNPVQDAEGNWVLTSEEIHASEFNNYKIALIDIIVDLEKIEWKPPLEKKIP
jgi:hypothetical protein